MAHTVIQTVHIFIEVQVKLYLEFRLENSQKAYFRVGFGVLLLSAEFKKNSSPPYVISYDTRFGPV